MIPATIAPRHAMKAPELMSATEMPAVWATAAAEEAAGQATRVRG
jgi:hypothetical protein